MCGLTAVKLGKPPASDHVGRIQAGSEMVTTTCETYGWDKLNKMRIVGHCVESA